MKAPVLLAAALALAACSAPGTEPPPPPPPPADAPAGTTGTESPKVLAEGDRWFVALRTGTGGKPVAERSRRARGDGFVREEVTWARSFAELARMEHGTAQVFALFLGEKGLTVSQLGETDRPVGEAGLEVAAPFQAGTAWTVSLPGGTVEGRIVGMEKVDTPGGTVEALRVETRAPVSPPEVMTIWYDPGLRPVRAEFRRGSAVIESRAALASATPSPEECRAAMDWARKNLPAPVVR